MSNLQSRFIGFLRSATTGAFIFVSFKAFVERPENYNCSFSKKRRIWGSDIKLLIDILHVGRAFLYIFYIRVKSALRPHVNRNVLYFRMHQIITTFIFASLQSLYPPNKYSGNIQRISITIVYRCGNMYSTLTFLLVQPRLLYNSAADFWNSHHEPWVV